MILSRCSEDGRHFAPSAGDSFNGAFVAALVSGDDAVMTARWGGRCASLVMSRARRWGAWALRGCGTRPWPSVPRCGSRSRRNVARSSDCNTTT